MQLIVDLNEAEKETAKIDNLINNQYKDSIRRSNDVMQVIAQLLSVLWNP